jgi:hypothetical protein
MEGATALRPSLEATFQTIKNAAAAGATGDQIAADFQFHRLIVEACGNRMLVRIFDEIALDLKLVIGLVGEVSADWRAIADSHLPVIEAIASGDPNVAIRAIKDHLHLSWDATLTKVRRSADAPIRPTTMRARAPESGLHALADGKPIAKSRNQPVAERAMVPGTPHRTRRGP